MTLLDSTVERRLGWLLILVTGLTRIPGLAGLHWPDGTLAALFLAGLCLTQSRFFGGLLVTAFLADLTAFRFGLAPPTCLTPAYLFLVPTYGLVWAAGRRAQRSALTGDAWLAHTALCLAVAIIAAFTLSNAAFYLVTRDMSALGGFQYAVTVSRYLPAYAGETLLYAAPVAVALRGRRHSRPAATATA